MTFNPIINGSPNRNVRWVGGLLSASLLMVAMYLLPLWETWGAYGTDGYECVGFPFHFLKCGGFSYRANFYPEWLFVDATILVLAERTYAEVFGGGVIASIRRFRTWGDD